jgi:hypothetical protein
VQLWAEAEMPLAPNLRRAVAEFRPAGESFVMRDEGFTAELRSVRRGELWLPWQ